MMVRFYTSQNLCVFQTVLETFSFPFLLCNFICYQYCFKLLAFGQVLVDSGFLINGEIFTAYDVFIMRVKGVKYLR
jgi:hypothetical protein